MKPRVLSAPKNLTRRFEARYRAQRQGQALLLAVVVMLFVALISAGFLATVAGNLNQTARTSEKNQATEAAKAGMAYINNRISSSAEGENWLPEMESPLPGPPLSAAYDAYYSPLAQIQGWAAKGYAKFPYTKYPAKLEDGADAPQFYAKVERVTDELDKAGMLRITVIGLGKDDPNVFHRMVSYRGGYQAAPIGRVAKTVSNYDFVAQKPQSALAESASADEVKLRAGSARFPSEGNFWITITPPNFSATRPIQRVFVTSVEPDGVTLKVTPNVTVDDYSDCVVDIATPLGAPTPLDYNRDGTAADTVSLDSSLNTFFQSARVNGSAYWQGNALIKNLQSAAAAAAANAGDPANPVDYARTVEASSVMTLDTGSTVTADTLVPDSNIDASFTSEIISDGKNRIAGDQLDPLRQTRTFTPPDLTSEANLARYRGLTRDSKPLNTANPSIASAYGYGQGIYINNIQDREKVETAAGVYREMTQKELIDLWTSTDTTKPEYRAPAAATVIPANNVDTASLEQKRLRGWVAPDEFKPRGVTIELFDKAGVPTIGITRDALIDGTTSGTPAGVKAWAYPDGTPKSVDGGGNITPSDFYEEVPLNATNGVIFAEGNVRIKGNATAATTSLTVVSLGNIYIEGSLGVDSDTTVGNANYRKVLLLARKNVIVNPTAVISRPENYTLTNAASTANGAEFDIPVYETAGFEKGDYVQVSTQPSPLLVTAVSATALTVDKDPLVTAGGYLVQIAKDTTDATRRNSRIASYNAVLQRRIPTPVGTAPVTRKIAFRHMAEKLKAADVTLTYTPAGPSTPPGNVSLFVKSLLTPAIAGTIASTEKKFYLTEDTNPHDIDLYSGTTPFTKSLAALLTDTNSGAPAGWTYDFAYTNPLLSGVPSIALAGIGNNRPNSITTFPSTRAAWNQIVYPTPAPVASLYLATSVAARTYGTAVNNVSTIGPVANAITGFGFNPDYLQKEDALTADVTFGGDDGTANVEQTVLPDSRDIVLPVSANAQNTFSFKLNQIAGLVDNTVAVATDPLPANRIPAYNLYGMRLDSPNADGSGAGTTLKIDAYVYAQTGSWIVIPGGYFDPNMKNVALDLNRDGDTTDVGETTPAYRYARYNYGIEFNGAIAENHAALINDAGTAKGIVRDWMDKWTYPTDAAATTWQPIKYQFDPTYVLGKLAANPTNPTDPVGPQAGFYMPVSNDILYQE